MPGRQTQQEADQPRRAVILTALPVEYKAVRAHLADCREEPHPKGTVYELGKFNPHGASWKILIAETGPGNPRAAMEAEKAINHFNPQVALFVGVAGGLKDVKLGDVVAATKVYGYESGKAGLAFKPRTDIGESTYRMEQRSRAESKKENWRGRIIGAAPSEQPEAFVAPIAAGEKVVADTRAAIYKFLRENYGDALAVEMEGIGFLTATHACHPVEALVIRGISDLVHDKSGHDEKERQDAASRHAAAFAFEVLAQLDFEVPKKWKPGPSKIWNVPHLRNPNFTGREQLLQDLHDALASGRPAALTQAIHGLGGVGKTQLAVEYAYRHAPDYDLVWWLRAEEGAALAADYAALAPKLGLPEAADQEALREAVRLSLSRMQKWLLIFENAGEPGDLRDYLPQGGGGHILITSRYSAWRGMAQPLEVKVWPRGESVAFLLKRTGQQDEAAAAELAQELGDLPLALEQAAAYMDACRQSISGYLQLFRKRHQELLNLGRPSQEYPDTVATTWDISFQRVQQESPPGADLLNLCAFLAPDDIPRELLEQGAGHLPQGLANAVADPLALNEALAALRRYSLVELGEDSLAVHRLVQAVVQDRLGEESRKEWAGAAAKLVNGAFPGDITTNMDSWPWCARLLPHALTAASHAEKFQAAPDAAARLFNQAGLYLQGRAEFSEARKAFERALAIDEATYGPNHPEVATDVNNLGNVLQALGDLAGAKAHFERALAIDEASFGPNHPNVAIRANNLGSVLQDLGDLAGARAHFERALAIFEAALGPNHSKVAIMVNNLGSVLQDLGDLAGAKSCYERALAIGEATLGPNHPKVAIRVNNLGLVLKAQGDLAGARQCFERALAIDEAAYGPNHPKVAIRVNNLGGVLQDQGDLKGAKAHYERALAIDEAAYGPNHPQVANYVNNLGGVLQDLGDLQGARAHYERALAIDEAAYGPNHPTVAIRVNNLGSVLKALGDLPGARAHYERALAIDEAAYGPNHPEVATDVNNLGGVLQDLGDLKGAKGHLVRALSIFREFLGDDHPQTKLVRRNLEILLRVLEKG